VIRRFLHGMASLPRGAIYFVARPRRWPLGLVPILITLLLFVGVGIGYYFLVDGLIDKLQAIPAPDRPQQALGWVRYLPAVGAHWLITELPRWAWHILFGLLFLLASWFTFVIVVNIVGAPWNDALAGRVEQGLGSETAYASEGARSTLAELATGIRHSLLRLIIYWAAHFPLLVLNLIPSGITNLIFLLVGVPWSVLFVAMEFADIPQSRRRLGFREKFGVVWAHRATMMGFGAATCLALTIPVVNVLSIPCAVTGMTLLYREEISGGEPGRA
jgi:CysZ protein